MKRNGKKIYVGLSGGVDSSVSAALLQKAGYDVTGVFIKVWQPDWIECSWKEDRRDAMRVAAHLGIPFVTLDLEKEYKEGVIDYMIAEYKAGRTPNPDVMCNREVKFGAFWQWAKANGADFIATGHYAQVRKANELRRASDEGHLGAAKAARVAAARARADASPRNDVSGVQFALLKGVDPNKDQSYFLWTLNQNDLPHVLFPIGHLEKPDVRKLARRFNLPTAEKKDSQGLCFVGKIDIKEFLAHYLKTEKGNVLDESGEVIGHHDGALFFTIGERHGFLIDKKTPNDAPYYVTDKDIEQNSITVSNKKQVEPTNAPSANKTVRLKQVNWVSGQAPEAGAIFEVRSRYRQELQEAKLISVGISETVLEFEEAQDTLAPGQSLVIYSGEECVGGGVIE